MILRSIKLEDFGLYGGVTEIDLIPRKRPGGSSPIILIGGQNGAGKTTLLEAVRLALYGRRSLGARVAQSEYQAYLRGRINRSALAAEAAVTLEFDYAEMGSVHRYRVRREWSARGKAVLENLYLEKDGLTIDSVPKDEWHSFLQELIPPGVSQLFFFDGEKIRDIADGEEDNDQLAESVKGLLGIELIGRLRTDLGLFIARHAKADDGGAPEQLLTLCREITAHEEKAATIADEVAELLTSREAQARAAETIRRDFVAEGGDAAMVRAKAEAAKEEVSRSLIRCEHEFKELSNKLLPFGLAPKLVSRFKAALEAGLGSEGKPNSIALKEAVAAWRTGTPPKRAARWSDQHWTDLESFLHHIAIAPRPARASPAFQEVGDGKATLARLNELEASIKPRARALLQQIDELKVRERQLDVVLTRAENAASGIKLDELRLAEQRVGALEARLRAKQEELSLLRGQLVTMQRRRRKLEESQAADAIQKGRSQLAAKVSQALASYEDQLLKEKLLQLRGEFVRRFNDLVRKPEMLADVLIDPTTFSATLIDRAGKEIPKGDLSAGEKQIYAIAMLWALAKCSGRPLPMIIDTPLARLDSEHRANLVHRYFPKASHQVILLSTDTEVDEGLLNSLGTSVSHTYRLDYDQTSSRTTVCRGYFQEIGRNEKRRNALHQA